MKSLATLLLLSLAILATSCGGSKSSGPDASSDIGDDQVLAVKTIEDENGNVDESMTEAAILQGDFQSQDDVEWAIDNGQVNWGGIDSYQDNEYGFGLYDEEEVNAFATSRGDNNGRRRGNGNDHNGRRRGDNDQDQARNGHGRGHNNGGWKHRPNYRPKKRFGRYRYHQQWAKRPYRPAHQVYRYSVGITCAYNTFYYAGRCRSFYNPYSGYRYQVHGGYRKKSPKYRHPKYGNNTYIRIRIVY